MLSILKKSAMFAAALLVFTAATARAETVEVKVAFPFQVNGQTLPAGRYAVEYDGSCGLLIRGEKGNHAEIFVSTMAADGHDPAGQKPALTFTRHDSKYRLSSVWESGTDGRVILDR